MEIDDSLKPYNYDKGKTELPISYTKTSIPKPEYPQKSMNETNVKYASCNICSTFKCDGDVRQLCGKYACMKN